ncbi:MAG TPA: SRPBCC domain-containing protein, partial [Euzebya sp.]|nr:SRPBCC domain-containing protein [Euzebya sp.]
MPRPTRRRSAATSVRRSRVLPAAPTTVWRHVLGANWLGFEEGGPTPGDRVRLRDPFGGDGPRDAAIRGVRAGEELRLEWWPTGRPDDRSEVTISLRPHEAGTRVTVLEQAVPGDLSLRAKAWT